MIFASVTDTSVTFLVSSKKLVGKPAIENVYRSDFSSVTAADTGALPEAVRFISGKAESLHPAESELSLVIYEETGVVLERFIIPRSEKNNLEKTIISRAKNDLHIDPLTRENFYEVLYDDSERIIIQYASVQKNLLNSFLTSLKNTRLKLRSLTCQSFSVFEIIKPYINKNEIMLYTAVFPRRVVFNLYDFHGLLNNRSERLEDSPADKVIENYITSLKNTNNLTVSQVIVAGKEGAGVSAEKLSASLNVPFVNADDLIGTYFTREGIKYSPADMPKGEYAELIGQFIQNQKKIRLNFVEELPVGEITSPDSVSENLPDSEVSTSGDNSSAIMPSGQSAAASGAESSPSSLETGSPIIQQPDTGAVVEYHNSPVSTIKSFLNKKLILPVGAAAILLILLLLFRTRLFGGISFLGGGSATPTVTPAPTVAEVMPTPSEAPVPTINSSLKRSGISISVRNGTEKTGYAKEIADYLSEQGYKNVTKGNADNNGYENSVIRIKASKKEYAPLLTGDLKSKIDTGTVEDLDEKEKTDAVVILGKK